MDNFLDFLGQEWLLFSVLGVLASTWFMYESRLGGAMVSCLELVDLMNNHSATVLDVRETNEFNKGHITGTRSMPLSVLSNNDSSIEQLLLAEPSSQSVKKQSSKKPKSNSAEMDIVLVCASGFQSGAAARLLRNKGFLQIRRLRGGIAEWRRDNLPLVVGAI